LITLGCRLDPEWVKRRKNPDPKTQSNVPNVPASTLKQELARVV
jgi:hypothetical protein